MSVFPSGYSHERPPPGTYIALIRRLAPAEDPAHVEAWMRAEHGCLESIATIDFARAAKSAADRARNADRATNDALARSFGIWPQPG